MTIGDAIAIVGVMLAVILLTPMGWIGLAILSCLFGACS